MTIGFDAYSLVARILPGYITIVPLTLPLLFSPSGAQLSFGASALLLPILYFIGYQIGDRRGKRIEKKLWHRWGGEPTTRFLRHTNDEFDARKKESVHKKLRELGLHVPTREQEMTDMKGADESYRYSTDEMIRRTRNLESYPLVSRSLISYGLQRNLFGLKWIGIAITLLSTTTCSIIIVSCQNPLDALGSMAVAILVNLGLLLIWAIWVTEKRVKREAEEYARRLFEATLNIK